MRRLDGKAVEGNSETCLPFNSLEKVELVRSTPNVRDLSSGKMTQAYQRSRYAMLDTKTFHINQHIPLANTKAATVAPKAHHPPLLPILSLASLPMPLVGLALPVLPEVGDEPVVVAGFVALATLNPLPEFAC